MFSFRMPVRFGDTDPAGLVYYPNLFHYCHVAMEEFFADQCGVSYYQLITVDRIGFPTVSVQSEFNHPLVYGDEVEIQIGVLSVGRSSLSLLYRLHRAADGLVCAESRQIHVAMNLDTRNSVAIPDQLREALAKAQPSQPA